MLWRLGVERLPLYMAHAFDPNVPQEETLAALDELIKEGKVRALGEDHRARIRYLRATWRYR